MSPIESQIEGIGTDFWSQKSFISTHNLILVLKIVKTLCIIQAALVIRGGSVPKKYREYQNREYQVQ